MMSMAEKNILVVYGGVSTEHEVSIISALQVMHALKDAGFKVLPGYITKEGAWLLGDQRLLIPEFYRNLAEVKRAGEPFLLPADREVGLLKRGWLGYGGLGEQIDAVFPVFHGRNGEDGAIQGLFELVNVPYVGCNVGASAVGMDKYLSKKVAADLGIRVVKDFLVTKTDWESDQKNVLKRLKTLGKILFVKPNDLGSTIGISRTASGDELKNALEVAFLYTTRVLVEQALDKKMELNISVMGNGPYDVSAIEQPVAEGDVLSFTDKYMRPEGKNAGMASAKRLIPAPIDDKLKKEVEETARKFFAAIGGKGISRIDFMVDKKGNLFFNEINTLPGSLSFYLWEASGIKFPELVKKLVKSALDDWEEKSKLITTFDSNILSNFAKKRLKGGKV